MKTPFGTSRTIIRLTMWVNLSLFILFVVPLTNHWINRGFRTLKTFNLKEPVGRSLQIWLVGSTVCATVLLAQILWKKRKPLPVGSPYVSVVLEGTLVAAWWVVVLGACAYGFMLGMAG